MNLCERCLGPEQAATIASLLLIASNVLSLDRPLAAPDCSGHESLRALFGPEQAATINRFSSDCLDCLLIASRDCLDYFPRLPPTVLVVNLCERLLAPNRPSTNYPPLINHFWGLTNGDLDIAPTI